MFGLIIDIVPRCPQNFLRQAAMQIPALRKLQAFASTLFLLHWSLGACHISAGSVGVRPYTAWSVSDSSEYVLFKGTPVTDVIATGQNMPCSALQLGLPKFCTAPKPGKRQRVPESVLAAAAAEAAARKEACKRLHAKIFHWRNHC